MRLGLLGGTFDPIHFGHLLMAEQSREQCRLDQVWLLPASQPPHKTPSKITTASQRAEMVEFAVAGHPDLLVNRMEFSREGKSFTVDTLKELREKQTDDELFFIIGADSLHDLPTWRDPEEIAQLAKIVVVNRGDRALPTPEELRGTLGDTVAERIQLVTMPGIDLSSTDIRRRIAEGGSIRYMVPRAVEAYIQEHGLYR